MKINLITSFIVILFLLLNSCNSYKRPHNSLKELEKLIALDYGEEPPLNVNWIKRNVDRGRHIIGPTDSELVAVMKFKAKNLKTIKEKISSGSEVGDRTFLQEEFLLDWYPKEVKKSFYMEGKFLRIKEKVYDINILIKGQKKSGFVFVADNKYLFISVYFQ